MSNNYLTMSKIRDILRLYNQKQGALTISKRTGVARNTVKKYLVKFRSMDLGFEDINRFNDSELNKLFGKNEGPPAADRRREDLHSFMPHMDKELKRTGVTLELMWNEYIAKYPEGYQRSRFGQLYKIWCKRSNPSMHLQHKAGDKMFLDYAGKKLQVIDQLTKQPQQVEVYVAILPASQLVYVEAVESQNKRDLVTSTENAFHYFGGAPLALVPDNLKSAVIKPHKYEPKINETFEDFAKHYGCVVLPARVRRPKDKAYVEGMVKIVYTRIYAQLRDKTFSSLVELNMAIHAALEELNNAKLTNRNYSRREQFLEIEKDTLIPLPPLKYEFKDKAQATVNKDGHVCLKPDTHYYSVPYQHIGKQVTIIYTKTLVEIYLEYDLIASHERMKGQHQYTTVHDHLASNHRFLTEWTKERFLDWARDVGEDVHLAISRVFEQRPHPEQAYKHCFGIMSLIRKYDKTRMNNACRRALYYDLITYTGIRNILDKGMDHLGDDIPSAKLKMPPHDNIRGDYE